MRLGEANLEERQRAMREKYALAAPLEAATAPAFAQRHYSVAEVAGMWGLSQDATRRIFEREPGVLVIGDNVGGAGTRRYRTLRIPESVLERVHRRLSRV